MSRSAPARRLMAVVPNDAADLPEPARSLYVGTGGDVQITAAGDIVPQTLKNVPDGTVLPIEVKRVWNAGTTANDIIALL